MDGSRSRKLGVFVLVLALASGVGLWQKTALWSWYCVQNLQQAEESQREHWIRRVVELDTAAQPRVLDCLTSSTVPVCTNAQAVLLTWVDQWKLADPRGAELLAQLHARFGAASLPGKSVALEVTTAFCQHDPTDVFPAAVARSASELLSLAVAETQLRPQTIRLAGVLLERMPQSQIADICRTLADQGLASGEPATRAAAVLLLLMKSFKNDAELQAKVVPLLRDPAASVRRAAVLVLGSNQDLVSEDDLLPLLHDADSEVTRLCEVALLSRGLREHHLVPARLISDERPSVRMEVIDFLGNAPDLEPAVWLRRLSQDPVPAVRAAAVRAAASQRLLPLRDRLQEMAQNDPNPTIRQLAHHYHRNTEWKDR